MIGYILQKEKDFKGSQELKGYQMKVGKHFIEDSVDTIRKVKLKGDPETYYVLSFEIQKERPISIKEKYSEIKQDKKADKIMTRDEIAQYLIENEELIEEEKTDIKKR